MYVGVDKFALPKDMVKRSLFELSYGYVNLSA